MTLTLNNVSCAPMNRLSSTIVLFLFFYNNFVIGEASSLQSQQTWEPTTYVTLVNPQTQEPILNVSYVRYVRLEIAHRVDVIVPPFSPECDDNGGSMQECSNRCSETNGCITWSYQVPPKECRCYNKVFRNRTLTSIKADANYQSFEIKVHIMRHKLL